MQVGYHLLAPLGFVLVNLLTVTARGEPNGRRLAMRFLTGAKSVARGWFNFPRPAARTSVSRINASKDILMG